MKILTIKYVFIQPCIYLFHPHTTKRKRKIFFVVVVVLFLVCFVVVVGLFVCFFILPYLIYSFFIYFLFLFCRSRQATRCL